MQFQIIGSLEFRLFLSTDLSIRTVSGGNLLGDPLISFTYILYGNSQRLNASSCGRKRHMVCVETFFFAWSNGTKLEGVYLKRKYSHCPILILCKCKFFGIKFSRLFIDWKILQLHITSGSCFSKRNWLWDMEIALVGIKLLSRIQNDNGRFIDEFLFFEVIDWHLNTN